MDNPDKELPKEYMSSFIYALGLSYWKKRSKRESKGIIEFFSYPDEHQQTLSIFEQI